MARKKRTVSDDYLGKLKAIAGKVLDEWDQSPSSFSECSVQKVTLERWRDGENLPSDRSMESFLRFMRLTVKRWNQYLDDEISFEQLWDLRGKESDERIITKESVVNDARTLSHEDRMFVIGEIARMTNNTIERIEKAELFALNTIQLKRLKILLVVSRASLGENGDTLQILSALADRGVSRALISSIVDQKPMGFPKKDYDFLCKFLLKPTKWVEDNLIGISNDLVKDYDDLIQVLS